MSGNTWALPGGAINRGETPTEGAIREAEEEIGLPRRSTQGVDPLMVVRQEIAILDHGDWRYTYVVADLLRDFKPRITDDEGLDVEWVPVKDVHRRPLHPDFADAWPQLLQIIYPSPINIDDQVARVDEDDQVTESGDQYMLDEDDDEDILSQAFIGYRPQGFTQNNDQNPPENASTQVLQDNSQEVPEASDQYILGEDDDELMDSQTLFDNLEQYLALDIDQQVVENVDQHVLQHHKQDMAEVSDDHDVAQNSGQDTVYSGEVEHVDQGVVENDSQNADGQDASADQDTGVGHRNTPERPTPAGHCKNYWHYGTHELETGNQARGLPMVYGPQSRHCTRLDHIAFRAMYDLGVPQAFYREVFAFIIEVVAVDRQKMVDWARQTLGLALVANDSEEQMLQDITLDVWDGLDEENMP